MLTIMLIGTTRICKAAIRKIQQVVRGKGGFKWARHIYQLKLELAAANLRHYHACNIQKVFRAWYSRKYRYSHERRKQYVRHVVQKGEEIVAQMNEYATQQRLTEEYEENQRRVDELNRLASGLHHLVSTKAIRGVYNPQQQYLETPTVNGKPVEEHISGVVKDLLRTKDRLRHSGLVADINGTLRVPLKGLKNKRSLQASVPYDAVDKEKRLETRLSALKVVDQDHSFLAGGRTKILDKTLPSLSSQEPFLDRWANPLLRRGELNPSPSVSSKPFFSSVGGNKSTVMPNGLFDVIAEAEETGGAVQRHLGKSSRFGVPDNADVTASLPHPPISSTQNTQQFAGNKSKKFVYAARTNQLFAQGSAVDPFASSSDEEDDEQQ